ncbi:MAG: adenosine monophosphate-protein transferase [Thermoprotei archaeon]|nr:MAG: adenosine monophosphate-protein transferase [Thermoprotei archaeon]RLF24707.1 MAG: adenosine monophosphate-protein transferase [Thermoprotei archaeon]
MSIKLEIVKVEVPEGCNVIMGQSHFIKTVEDLYEAMVNAVPEVKFGLAFCEASGPRLVRYDGNDEELIKRAVDTALKVAAGHFFVIFLRGAYPINVLDRIKATPEVLTIFCATANPVQVIVAETDQGRAVLGVVDGFKSAGVESEKDIEERKSFLRKIGYKR